ncbi:unnamed protein product [Dovyalis caffra]|uniref:Uncharacterized protein n=1 Tax=Dovyalis caffra TaxID=77055 RepID=A0AAV1QR10_9ROSI|nr:unnamed protein product [Dovyalis caffra]
MISRDDAKEELMAQIGVESNTYHLTRENITQNLILVPCSKVTGLQSHVIIDLTKYIRGAKTIIA